jgi:fructosamine-3-kinase
MTKTETMERRLQQRLEAALGAAVTTASPLPVGFGLEGFRVALADGRRLAVKARPDRLKPRTAEAPPGRAPLEIEAFMLGELLRLSDLPVPAVHYAAPDLLAMDYIDTDGGPMSEAVERHAAALIANLHGVRGERFGYGRDTLIGPLAQTNRPSKRWVPFFAEQRLLAMAQAAHAEMRLSSGDLKRLERLAGRLDRYLSEPAYPSLLHGDLWSGNILAKGSRVAGFVDPALYFGHAEIELAFGTLFGTFGAAFFEAYGARRALEPGFHEIRKDIYNLYPRLVHLRLFGGAYLAGIREVLDRLGQ